MVDVPTSTVRPPDEPPQTSPSTPQAALPSPCGLSGAVGGSLDTVYREAANKEYRRLKLIAGMLISDSLSTPADDSSDSESSATILDTLFRGPGVPPSSTIIPSLEHFLLSGSPISICIICGKRFEPTESFIFSIQQSRGPRVGLARHHLDLRHEQCQKERNHQRLQLAASFVQSSHSLTNLPPIFASTVLSQIRDFQPGDKRLELIEIARASIFVSTLNWTSSCIGVSGRSAKELAMLSPQLQLGCAQLVSPLVAPVPLRLLTHIGQSGVPPLECHPDGFTLLQMGSMFDFVFSAELGVPSNGNVGSPQSPIVAALCVALIDRLNRGDASDLNGIDLNSVGERSFNTVVDSGESVDLNIHVWLRPGVLSGDYYIVGCVSYPGWFVERKVWNPLLRDRSRRSHSAASPVSSSWLEADWLPIQQRIDDAQRNCQDVFLHAVRSIERAINVNTIPRMRAQLQRGSSAIVSDVGMVDLVCHPVSMIRHLRLPQDSGASSTQGVNTLFYHSNCISGRANNRVVDRNGRVTSNYHQSAEDTDKNTMLRRWVISPIRGEHPVMYGIKHNKSDLGKEWIDSISMPILYPTLAFADHYSFKSSPDVRHSPLQIGSAAPIDGVKLIGVSAGLPVTIDAMSTDV